MASVSNHVAHVLSATGIRTEQHRQHKTVYLALDDNTSSANALLSISQSRRFGCVCPANCRTACSKQRAHTSQAWISCRQKYQQQQHQHHQQQHSLLNLVRALRHHSTSEPLERASSESETASIPACLRLAALSQNANVTPKNATQKHLHRDARQQEETEMCTLTHAASRHTLDAHTWP